MNKMSFEDAKLVYTKVRDEEKKKLIDYLISNGYHILTMNGSIAKNPYRTGSGKSDYCNGDLSNWKWVSCLKLGQEYLISLQAFDIDEGTKNHHVIMDRIGVYTCEKGYTGEDVYNKMVNTGIDLPLTQLKLEKLLSYLV